METNTSGIPYNPAAVVITGGTISIPGLTQTGGAGNTEYTLAQSAVPVIAGPTGTMGNNGAVTWGTALPDGYTGGAWVAMPAGSIAAGVPAAAAILWYVGTNTTTGTFYNSTYTTGVPTIGTATAFATTGPGAFTGITTEILTIGIQIPANAIGPNGAVIVEHHYTRTSNGDAIAYKLYFHTANAIGGTNVSNVSAVSTGTEGTVRVIENRGLTNKQVSAPLTSTSSGIVDAVTVTYSAVDSTAATWINFSITRGTATDAAVTERMAVKIRYGA